VRLPCWTLVVITRLVHIVWFCRRIAELFLDYSSFFLDAYHFRTLTTCNHSIFLYFGVKILECPGYEVAKRFASFSQNARESQTGDE